MTLPFHALWMLCALGAVVCAAAAARHVREQVAMGAGFVAAALFASPDRLPDPASVGTAALVAVAIYLFKPRFALVSAGLGGALAGVWTALIEVQGLPSPVAIPAAAAVVIATIWLTRRRPSFAPDDLRDEGLLMIGVLAFATAIMPGILDGWQAAANLAATTDRRIQVAVPMSTMVLLLVSASLGAFYSHWSRR